MVRAALLAAEKRQQRKRKSSEARQDDESKAHASAPAAHAAPQGNERASGGPGSSALPSSGARDGAGGNPVEGQLSEGIMRAFQGTSPSLIADMWLAAGEWGCYGSGVGCCVLGNTWSSVGCCVLGSAWSSVGSAWSSVSSAWSSVGSAWSSVGSAWSSVGSAGAVWAAASWGQCRSSVGCAGAVWAVPVQCGPLHLGDSTQTEKGKSFTSVPPLSPLSPDSSSQEQVLQQVCMQHCRACRTQSGVRLSLGPSKPGQASLPTMLACSADPLTCGGLTAALCARSMCAGRACACCTNHLGPKETRRSLPVAAYSACLPGRARCYPQLPAPSSPLKAGKLRGQGGCASVARTTWKRQK